LRTGEITFRSSKTPPKRTMTTMSIAASRSVTFTKVPTSAAIPGNGADPYAAGDGNGGGRHRGEATERRITSTWDTREERNAFSPTGTTFGRPSGGGSDSRTISLM